MASDCLWHSWRMWGRWFVIAVRVCARYLPTQTVSLNEDQPGVVMERKGEER